MVKSCSLYLPDSFSCRHEQLSAMVWTQPYSDCFGQMNITSTAGVRGSLVANRKQEKKIPEMIENYYEKIAIKNVIFSFLQLNWLLLPCSIVKKNRVFIYFEACWEVCIGIIMSLQVPVYCCFSGNPSWTTKESGILRIGNLESNNWNPESTACNPESKTVLDSYTYGKIKQSLQLNRWPLEWSIVYNFAIKYYCIPYLFNLELAPTSNKHPPKRQKKLLLFIQNISPNSDWLKAQHTHNSA